MPAGRTFGTRPGATIIIIILNHVALLWLLGLTQVAEKTRTCDSESGERGLRGCPRDFPVLLDSSFKMDSDSVRDCLIGARVFRADSGVSGKDLCKSAILVTAALSDAGHGSS